MITGVRWPDPAVQGWSHHVECGNAEKRDEMFDMLVRAGREPELCNCGRLGVFPDEVKLSEGG